MTAPTRPVPIHVAVAHRDPYVRRRHRIAAALPCRLRRSIRPPRPRWRRRRRRRARHGLRNRRSQDNECPVPARAAPAEVLPRGHGPEHLAGRFAAPWTPRRAATFCTIARSRNSRTRCAALQRAAGPALPRGRPVAGQLLGRRADRPRIRGAPSHGARPRPTRTIGRRSSIGEGTVKTM